MAPCDGLQLKSETTGKKSEAVEIAQPGGGALARSGKIEWERKRGSCGRSSKGVGAQDQQPVTLGAWSGELLRMPPFRRTES